MVLHLHAFVCISLIIKTVSAIPHNNLIENQSAADSMKGILSSSGFKKQWGYYIKELKSTLQTSHKTTKWTDLLIEPEEMAVNGQTCERRRKMETTVSVTVNNVFYSECCGLIKCKV